MAADGVFPTEMPDDPRFPTDPLDDDTAECLLRGRLAPEDAPGPYTEVARVLRAAAAPPTPRELAGQPAALAAFRTAKRTGSRSGSTWDGVGRGSAWGGVGRGSAWGGVGRGRVRVVALALAGTLAVGGLWMAAGAQTAPGLRSPTGGPGAGGSGSATSSSGLLRPAMPPTGPAGDRAATGRATAPPPDRDPAAARPGGAASQGAAHRAHPAHPGKPPKPKPSKPRPKPKKPKAPPGHGRSAAISESATQRP
jgi:hypothetical protein